MNIVHHSYLRKDLIVFDRKLYNATFGRKLQKKALHKYIFYFLNENTLFFKSYWKFFGVSMKVKNIFFGFLKALLLAVIFYSSLLSAEDYFFFDFQDYQPLANSPPPYFFQIDPMTGNLVKIIKEDSFRFKTYNLRLKADLELYNAEVRPTLLKWEIKIRPFEEESNSSSLLSGGLVKKIDGGSGGDSLGEVHIATYEDRIEAVSYVTNKVPGVPEIDTLVASPEGMRVGQTGSVKGAGSSLLDYELKIFNNRGDRGVRLYSIRDQYYLDRGWQRESDVQGACR
ncbi:hypothetical protein [Bathymodiolus thermophilus thioautotrophic gill symbiont]|uniref:Uncharacterized protein n=1 Tax=Bathymodiolus thermophilus thioautotrophic gill symbiont TaxID=2360 RepID=A0A1J5UK53_9GAMM|nr:hypothetical protein [Bathymodiolus thermophilus thioautotrophic gill symbiont]OIR24639.1 hypothetical protein BGC33_11205 [Bathymodiolus thermophilus thioautotrophic gill symbiont]